MNTPSSPSPPPTDPLTEAAEVGVFTLFAYGFAAYCIIKALSNESKKRSR